MARILIERSSTQHCQDLAAELDHVIAECERWEKRWHDHDRWVTELLVEELISSAQMNVLNADLRNAHEEIKELTAKLDEANKVSAQQSDKEGADNNDTTEETDNKHNALVVV